jgi:dTDP-4-amino-4,6-dideoxygalactose transaminase
MSWEIPLSDLDFGPEESAAVSRVLQNKWLSMGPETKAFEEEFAAYLGAHYACAVSNGTAALHLAFLALGIGPGDAVIQPAVNFVASANMTVAVGATPIFADICALAEPTILPEAIEQTLATFKIQHSGLRPRAVVVMHYGGYACRMAEILEICKKHNLYLIEDACHGVGARIQMTDVGDQRTEPSEVTGRLHGPRSGEQEDGGQRSEVSDQDVNFKTSDVISHPALGTIGDIGCFSFFSNKNLVTGEGGMVTANRDDLIEKVRRLRSHGMNALTWDRHRGHAATYDVLAHGYNYRLDDLRSALGREQLKKLPRNNQRRQELTALYWEKLSPLEEKGWILPFKSASNIEHPTSNELERAAGENRGERAEDRSQKSEVRSQQSAFHLMTVVAPDADTRWSCAEALKNAGIQTSLHYPLIPAFTGFAKATSQNRLEQSAAFCQRIITLPLFPTMTEEQVECVAAELLIAAVTN